MPGKRLAGHATHVSAPLDILSAAGQETRRA